MVVWIYNRKGERVETETTPVESPVDNSEPFCYNGGHGDNRNRNPQSDESFRTLEESGKNRRA